jgi:hypothetical protein
MLTALFSRSYVTTNKHGQKTNMFVYTVTGTPAELATFEQVQGEHYRVNADGTPVFITPKGHGPQVNLVVTEATEDKPARIIADTSATAMAASLMEQYKGTPIADAIAQQLATALLGTAKPAPVPPTTEG